MSHYRPKKHNEYKIGIVSKKEYKDLVPHKEYADKTFGFANPKEKTAVIIDTGNKKLNQQHIEHELEELIITNSPHEVDGIRYGWLSDAWDSVVDAVSNVGEEVGDWVEGTFLPEGVKATINDIPLVGDALSRGWLGKSAQQLTDEGKEASMFSNTSQTIDQIHAAIALIAAIYGGGAALGSMGAGGGAAAGSGAGASGAGSAAGSGALAYGGGTAAGGSSALWAPTLTAGAGQGAASSWVPAALAGAGGASSGLGPLANGTSNISQGGNMASIYNPDGSINWEAVIQQQSQPATNTATGIYNPDGSVNWGALTGQDPSLGTSGAYNPYANIYGSGGIPPSGWGGQTVSTWDNVVRLLKNLTGNQDPQSQGSGVIGALGTIAGGLGGGGTLGPLAMLAYLNQKSFDYPSPSPIEWPSWMEQARQTGMNPAEYDIASNKFQSLMGTDPTESIMAGLNAQQGLDRTAYEKYINPIMAQQGQLDSTYRANMLGDYLKNQQAQALTQRGTLAQWVPEFQSSLATSLGNLGSQRSASGQGWYGQGLGYTTLANTPSQRGFELEYQKVKDAETAKNQAEQLWSAIMMGNLFPQNPVFNPNWGSGQTGTGTGAQSQSDLQKYLGYANTGLNAAQTGKGLWDLGSSIYNWF